MQVKGGDEDKHSYLHGEDRRHFTAAVTRETRPTLRLSHPLINEVPIFKTGNFNIEKNKQELKLKLFSHPLQKTMVGFV